MGALLKHWPRIVVTLRGANGQAVATMSSPVLDPVVGTWNQLRTATLVVPATAVTADFDFATRLDPGFSSIDIGADDLSLVWDVGPACSLRNGSGINPLDLACVTPPRLGTTWQLAIATNPTTVLSAAVLGLAPQIPPLPLPQFGGGEILIGSTLASLAGSAPTLGLAAQPAAQGLVVFVQGARLDVVGGVATVVLTNALDAVLAQ